MQTLQRVLSKIVHADSAKSIKIVHADSAKSII